MLDEKRSKEPIIKMFKQEINATDAYMKFKIKTRIIVLDAFKIKIILSNYIQYLKISKK